MGAFEGANGCESNWYRPQQGCLMRHHWDNPEDGTCEESDLGGENCGNCPEDCGECASCGDGVCQGDETDVGCPLDCGCASQESLCNLPEPTVFGCY